MKKRLLGLLALTLCLMFAAMPVAMAGFKYENSSAEVQDLVEGETKIALESGHTIYYWQNGYDGTVGEKHEHSQGDLFTCPSVSGYWYVIEIDGNDMSIEGTGPATVLPFDDGTQLLLFNRILSLVDDDEILGADEIEEEFKQYAKDHGLGTAFAFYDVASYTDKGSYLRKNPTGQSYSFILPVPQNASNVRVLHYNSDHEVDDKLSAVQTPQGVQVTTNHFSPFAVVYTPVSQPKTGDNAQLALWCALAGLSLAGMAVIAVRRRKNA